MSDALKVFIGAMNGNDIRDQSQGGGAEVVERLATDLVRLRQYLDEIPALCASATTYFPVRLEGGVLVHAPGGVAPRQLTAEEATALRAAYAAADRECAVMEASAKQG